MTLAAHEPRAKQNLTRGQVVKRLHRTFAVLVECAVCDLSPATAIRVNSRVEPKVIREFDFNRRSCIGGRPQAEAPHGMKLTHKFAVPAPKKRPQDPPIWDRAALRNPWREYPDVMPQAIKLIDSEGCSCICVPITQDGKVVEGFKMPVCSITRVKSATSRQ